VPPTTGEYTFWISSENQSVLRISTDDSPDHLRVVARVAQGRDSKKKENAFANWDATHERKSDPIQLEAGKRYNVEVLNKQGHAGNDARAEVAWSGPGIERALIDGKFLVPANPTQLPAPKPPTPGVKNLTVTDDSYVRAGGSAARNFNFDWKLIVDSARLNMGPHVYLKFDLSTVSAPVKKAVLRFVPVEVSEQASENVLHFVPNDKWSEAALTFENAPKANEGVLASWTPVLDQPVEIDVTGLVNQEIGSDKILSLTVTGKADGGGLVSYASAEDIADYRPQLILQTE
jgi:hypothetical protein